MKKFYYEKHGERYLATDERIIECGLKMLKGRDLKSLRVRQICEELSINRATFYAHFDDIYDMFDQIEKKMMEEMTLRFLALVPDSMEAALLGMLQFIREHQDFYRYYLSNGGSVKMSPDMLGGLLGNKKFLMKEDGYHMVFMIFGVSGVLRRFVLEQRCDPREEQKVIQCILHEIENGFVGTG